MSGKPSIWKSRKFWILIFDVIVSLIVTLSGWYLAPAVQDRIVTLIGILQAPVLFLIGAIAYEDAASMHAESAAYAAEIAKEAAAITAGAGQNVEGGAG